MKGLAEFTKTTLIGGLLVVLPIYVSILLLAKTLSGILALLSPVTAALPAGGQFRQVIAILIVLAVCFVAGIVVRTGPGRRAKNVLERLVLEKIPGYALVRGLAERVSGDESEGAFRPALVEVEEALSPGFIIEELDDGRYTVLVPSVPTPAAGSLFILPRERVHPLDVPFTQAVKVISKWGAGRGGAGSRSVGPVLIARSASQLTDCASTGRASLLRLDLRDLVALNPEPCHESLLGEDEGVDILLHRGGGAALRHALVHHDDSRPDANLESLGLVEHLDRGVFHEEHRVAVSLGASLESD
jgi:uncharacterized membrane protein